jgi:hypothetical protein
MGSWGDGEVKTIPSFPNSAINSHFPISSVPQLLSSPAPQLPTSPPYCANLKSPLKVGLRAMPALDVLVSEPPYVIGLSKRNGSPFRLFFRGLLIGHSA